MVVDSAPVVQVRGGGVDRPRSQAGVNLLSDACRRSWRRTGHQLILHDIYIGVDLIPSQVGDDSQGMQAYYISKIEDLKVRCARVPRPIHRALQVAIRDKVKNLRRLEAQRNELNAKGPRCKHIIGSAHAAASAPAAGGVVAAVRARLARGRGRQGDEQVQGPG